MPPIEVLWGMNDNKLTVDVEPGTTVEAFSRILAERYNLGSEISIQLLSAASPDPLKDSDMVEPTEGGYRALPQLRPTLYLAKHSAEVATTALLAKKMSCTGWHGRIGGKRVDLIVKVDCKTHPCSDNLPENVISRAKAVQKLIEGILLPGSESDFEGYAFVVDPGVEADMKQILWESFGFLGKSSDEEVTLEGVAWNKKFTRESDQSDDEDVEGDAEEQKKLAEATAILKGFGKTYTFNFTEDVVCGPVLYFAQNPDDKVILGVINCRVWT